MLDDKDKHSFSSSSTSHNSNEVTSHSTTGNITTSHNSDESVTHTFTE